MKGSEQKDLYKQLGDQSIGTISINLAISLVTDVSANPGETVMTVGSPRPLLSFNLSITDQEPELGDHLFLNPGQRTERRILLCIMYPQ